MDSNYTVHISRLLSGRCILAEVLTACFAVWYYFR